MIWKFDGTSLTLLAQIADCLQNFPPYNCGGSIDSVEVYDDVTGPKVYASGQFDTPDDLNNVARLDGGIWRPLGQGAPGLGRLLLHDDGSGPRLHLHAPSYDLRQRDGVLWNPVPGVPTGPGSVDAT